MQVAVASINFIKSRALSRRQFKEHLADQFSEYEDVSYYCEVRRLSKGQMLTRFCNLIQDIADFMDVKGNTINQVKDNERVCDLVFLVYVTGYLNEVTGYLNEVTGYLNELNFKLQKQGQLVHELHGNVKAFCNKLRFLESQIRAKNCYKIPTLATHKNIPCNCYGDELMVLIEQFDTRFADLTKQRLHIRYICLSADVNSEPENLQMEVIELQADLVIK
jgi:hypothetical protein